MMENSIYIAVMMSAFMILWGQIVVSMETWISRYAGLSPLKIMTTVEISDVAGMGIGHWIFSKLW